MRKSILLTSLALAIVHSGCNKYMEVEPDNRAKLTDPEKVSQLLGTAYPAASYMAFCEAMSDNATDKGVGDQRIINSDAYAFKDIRDDNQDSPDNYWNECYRAIAAANQALEACASNDKPETYLAQKGEALVARAYAHFMLVTLYSKPYDPATSASDPGIPYVTEPETVVVKKYDRKTVAYVYEMIEKDLLEGLPLLSDKSYDVPRYHFNRNAANAFAARFYLYKQDYNKVIEYANASVTNFLSNLRPWNTSYQNFNLNELPLEYQRSNQAANLLLVTCVSNYAYNYTWATQRYGLNSPLNLNVVQRVAPVTNGAWSFISGQVGSQENVCYPKLHMRDFAYSSPTSGIGYAYATLCLFTTEELLFNKAEANTYLGNYSAAINDLNLYMSTRLTGVTPGNLPSANRITEAKIKSYFGTSDVQAGLISLILMYKRAEFVQEGMRWFDNLRYRMTVRHPFMNASGTQTDSIMTVDPDDYRRQLKLPDAVKLSGIDNLNR